MKEIYQQYAAYNVWANNLLLQTILQLPEEMHKKEVVSSFPSLYQTVLHMWDADSAWWQRIKLLEKVTPPSASFNGDMKALADASLQQNKAWVEWIGSVQEHVFQHVFQYQNSKKEQFKQPIYQVLQHVFNHATYHRGQLVCMLRQLGVDKIPQTDYIAWSRKKH